MGIPYSSATSGNRAREEVVKVLRRFGCEKVGFMDDHAKHEVTLYFEHRGRASAIAGVGERMGADVAQGKPALIPRPQIAARP